MTIELTRQDLIAMVKGVNPSFSAMKLLKEYGTYTGGFKDDWKWNSDAAFARLSEQELYNLYIQIRDLS